MEKTFQIGDFCFKLIYPQDISIPDHFLRFETENDGAEYVYKMMISNDFPQAEGRLIAKRADLMVYNLNGLEIRYIGIKGIPEYYACYKEVDEGYANVYIHPQRMAGLSVDPVFVSLLALERRMIQKDSLILHCAYISYQNEAILFSAPSETGKTTQANLWEKYMHSKTINGDRGLLTKKKDEWIIQGFPVCGTSDVCFNETKAIKAIVMLSQGKENSVTRLNPLQAFTQIIGQITKNQWNIQTSTKTIDLIEHLVNKVPIYHLSCTISKEAVDCLVRELYGEAK